MEILHLGIWRMRHWVAYTAELADAHRDFDFQDQALRCVGFSVMVFGRHPGHKADTAPLRADFDFYLRNLDVASKG